MDVRAPAPEPRVTIAMDGDRQKVVVAGDWTIEHAPAMEAAMAAVRAVKCNRLKLNVHKVGAVDSVGAWLLHRERARFEYQGKAVKVEGAHERLAYLMAEMVRHAGGPVDRPSRPYWPVRFLIALGRAGATVGRDALALLAMLGVFGFRLVTIFVAFRRIRGTAILSNFERACQGAVPIVMLMSFLIGLIIAQQAGFYLREFGATIFVVDLSGVLILREIGVLLAAILVAGRSGSAFTAEIGSMKMREEVDALHVLGLDPVEILVVPRLMALMLAMPILAFLSDIAALFGAGLISWLYLGITPDLFIQRLNEVVTPLEFWIGIAKAPFMALIIGLVACNEGLKVAGSAESLGRHTTSAVVKSIFLVIVVDGAFAVFFAAVGL